VHNPFSVGKQVNIEWNGQILETTGALYRITYKDYSADWDEWVDASRIRPAR